VTSWGLEMQKTVGLCLFAIAVVGLPKAPAAAAPPAVSEHVSGAVATETAGVQQADLRAVGARPVARFADRAGEKPPRLADFGLTEGAIVDASNIDQHREIVDAGVQWGVRQGWRLRVVEPKSIRMPRRYAEATEKYAGQVKLTAAGLSLRNYVAGQPFPHIDPNDPKAVLKIMWNFYYNWSPTDDVTQRSVDTSVGSIRKNAPMDVERTMLLDAYRKMNYNARLYVDPRPDLPNPEGVRFKESLHPMLEPFDIKGLGATFYRYLDPAKQDDSWVYLPQMRRVRRLSTAQRSDALFGQDVDADMFWGYNGHIAWMEYKLLGERTILATVHAHSQPARWQSPEGWLYEDDWEPRRVWVVEAVSKSPQYGFGKRILFVDKEAWIVPISEAFDRAGQLWKVWVAMWAFKNSGMTGGGGTRYEDEMGFEHATVVLDTQLSHATATSIPSAQATDREGFHVNQGEKSGTTEEFFTISNLIEAGS